MPRLSNLASGLTAETAFTVLALARELKSRGKDVVELEIGDSPFPTTPAAKAAGLHSIEANETGYGPSLGLPEFRSEAARFVNFEFGFDVNLEHVVVASGAKPFEQYFAEAILNPGDGALIFSPHFPTYIPNLERRGARAVLSPLRVEEGFRPGAAAVAHFLATDPRPRAIFLNSPHNPTGGVATRSDLRAIAEIVRGTDLMVFSDEPYCHMVWNGRHESIATEPGMLDHVVSAYTFSKSYSMSGWRIGFAVAHTEIIEAFGKLINTSASCSPPFVQKAALAALARDASTRDEYMALFHRKVDRLVEGLQGIEGLHVVMPAGTFYVYPDVRPLCNRLKITSQGLALFLLEGADDDFGVACLGGESFGEAGRGFLRFSCAESDERIKQALSFLPDALHRVDRLAKFLDAHPHLRLLTPYNR
ncbi:pyridoxal phosphate-dependent aminotransferase [Tundrisphaera lichenicola]|uniref:pyridoxal phosphate-dependent aminotransferase n=1 Tax=Tundrisphaera lichenicola TaxID=2029860 RepID=UPI003EBE726B